MKTARYVMDLKNQARRYVMDLENRARRYVMDLENQARRSVMEELSLPIGGLRSANTQQ